MELKKRSEIIFFVIAPLSFFTKILYNLFSVNDFFAQIMLLCSLKSISTKGF